MNLRSRASFWTSCRPQHVELPLCPTTRSIPTEFRKLHFPKINDIQEHRRRRELERRQCGIPRGRCPHPRNRSEVFLHRVCGHGRRWRAQEHRRRRQLERRQHGDAVDDYPRPGDRSPGSRRPLRGHPEQRWRPWRRLQEHRRRRQLELERQDMAAPRPGRGPSDPCDRVRGYRGRRGPQEHGRRGELEPIGAGRLLTFCWRPGDRSPDSCYAGSVSVFGRPPSGLYKTTDGGSSWSPAGLTNLRVRALAVDPQSPATHYAGTSGGGVFKSTDGGESWSAVNTGLINLDVPALAIYPQTPTTLYPGTPRAG